MWLPPRCVLSRPRLRWTQGIRVVVQEGRERRDVLLEKKRNPRSPRVTEAAERVASRPHVQPAVARNGTARRRRAAAAAATTTTPAAAAWICAPPPHPRVHRRPPRPPGACAPCRPARPSLATRARPFGVERRRRAAGRLRRHPRARAERRALRFAAHRLVRPGGAAAHSLTLALARHLVRRTAQEHLVTWLGLG